MRVYCVEAVMPPDREGLAPAIGRFWTADELKARREAAKVPGRVLREFDLSEVPPAVRANIERAQREAAQCAP